MLRGGLNGNVFFNFVGNYRIVVYFLLTKQKQADMSFLKNVQSTKSFNPMHSSHIFVKSKHDSSAQKPTEQSKLSQWYTRATSELGGDSPQYSNLMQNYESKIRNMQQGYQRSKQQFENSIKQMYKEKIILLNIIGNNHDLVDQFRRKIKLSPQAGFREVETKYNIITSGLFHSQLCSHCIANISRTETQTSRSLERDSVKNPQKSAQKSSRSRPLGVNKQYSWAYAPTEDYQLMFGKLKNENQRLRNSMEETIQDSIRKINEKNKQIEQLKLQANRFPPGAIHKIVHINQKESIAETKEKMKLRQLSRQKDIKHEQDSRNKELYQGLVREMNEKLVCHELQRLNAKYKMRYY